jgi:50S ribosomal protein L16 3-hydroxylase
VHLDNFDIDAFLREYWQKKPLLIKNPWGAWANPLEPDELAGLACEDEVESRLITQAGEAWPNTLSVEDGPLPEARFGELGARGWTLLVQAVDHYVPEVAALIEPFRFVPNWRIDDIMVSLAADGGGVGPHFDQYDVFLIQGLGKRRWQVGALCDAETELLPHDDLRLLANFEATEEWLLEPGDILYVPPRVAHNGVAVGGDCMTYSVGFRAPSRAELIADFADDLTADMADDDRYSDPGLQAQSNPGEISAESIAGLHAMITATLGDAQAFARWFGGYNSAPKYPDIDWKPEAPIEVEQLREMIANCERLNRNPASRFAFIRQDAGAVLLFVDGGCFECDGETAEFAEALCAQAGMPVYPDLVKSDSAMTLIAQLINQGSIAFVGED